MASRVLWLGLGAAGAAVAYKRGRKALEKYLPEQLAQRAEESAYSFGNRLKAAAVEFTATFESARKDREAELTSALQGQTGLEQSQIPELARGHRVVEVIRNPSAIEATSGGLIAASHPTSGELTATKHPTSGGLIAATTVHNPTAR